MPQLETKSCLECRRLHYKCTGDRPKCRRCVNKGTSCDYAAKEQRCAKILKKASSPRVTTSVPSNSKTFLESDITFPTSLTPQSIDTPISKHIIPVKDHNIIIQEYYKNFHSAHPFMPSYEDVFEYIDNSRGSLDLVCCMMLVGSRTQVPFASVEATILGVLLLIEASKLDLVSSQMLLMLFFVAHLNALHAVADNIRQSLVKLCFDSRLHCFDAPSLSSSYVGPKQETIVDADISQTGSSLIMLGSREQDSLLADCARRVFWEILHIDTLLGIADGKSVSSLMSVPFLINYPNNPKREIFDYQGRTESAILLNKVMDYNCISKEEPNENKFKEVKASLANWDLRLKLGNNTSPELIHCNGKVNEGVHQSILLYTHAKLLFHRPLSFLYDPTQVQPNPPCSLLSSTRDQHVHSELFKMNDTTKCSRQAIETRRCINVANDAIVSIIDTESCEVLRRTPLICCTLTFSCLTHLSGYLWIERTLKSKYHDVTPLFTADDLNIIKEYLKLSLACLSEMSTHWNLPGYMHSFLKHTIYKYALLLYTTLGLEAPRKEALNNSDIADTTNTCQSADGDDTPLEDIFEMSDWTSLQEMESVLSMVQEADYGW